MKHEELNSGSLAVNFKFKKKLNNSSFSF